VRTPLMFLFLSLTSACSTLEGTWTGNMKCQDGGNWDAEFDIAKNEYGDTEFSGTVENALTCRQDNNPETEDIPCDFIMTGTVEPTGKYPRDPETGRKIKDANHILDMRIDHCSADAGILGSTGFGCEDPYVAEWDDRRDITIEHETSGDIACQIKLKRQ
jgi:hypothetical protein